MSEQMFEVSEEIFRLLSEHIHNKCHNKRCCIEQLISDLEEKNTVNFADSPNVKSDFIDNNR